MQLIGGHAGGSLHVGFNGPYPKLFKISNFKGAGGPMFKTCQYAPYNYSSNDNIRV